jgi:NTE family protein
LIKKYFEEDLPQTFEELHIKTYLGATDMYTAHLILFEQGKIIPPLLGSIALPGVFPSIKYQQYFLNDGGIIDNFPTTIAQKAYPHHHIIGVALNKFQEHQEPKNVIETLSLALEVMMRKDMVKRSKDIAISFYEDIDCNRLERNKKKWKKAFEQGYASGIEKFQQH